MERKIKFKARRIDNGEWVKGYFYQECGNTYIIEDRQSESMLNRNHPHSVAPTTVCQYTGIVDKNNKPIYEHDLVRNTFTNALYEIVWNDVYACYSFLDTYYHRIAAKNFADYKTDDILIVGNKYNHEKEST